MAGTAWQRSTPRPDRSSWTWQKARQAALARDGHRCRAIEPAHQAGQPPRAGIRQGTGAPQGAGQGIPHGTRCTATATEVDHIAQGDDHSLNNLLSLCSHHHRAKTQAEAARARWKHRAKREPEKHPGLLP